DEGCQPQVEAQNKMLKDKLVSHLRFEPERAEVLLMAKGSYIACELADSRKKDNSELSSSVKKKYSILHTAVYRASTERKHKEEIKEEGMCSGKVFSREHKEGREESACQPTMVSEHETMKLKRSRTKLVSLMSKNENLKKILPTSSVCKSVQQVFGTSPSPTTYDNIRRTEMQTSVFEPSCHKKVCEQPKAERSPKKPMRAKVYSYDKTEPIDDDVTMHILRLRGKLGWQTVLPSRECLAREADMARLQKFALTRPLLLKDSGEYIYCLQRNKNNFKVPYNPYDLQPVSTNTAMHNKEYWTITASFVSKFSANQKLGEMEATPVPQWLHERHLYCRLLNLNLFSSFRMKKFFLLWKINVRRSK
ncbi:DYH14 protein, partial [Anseranas semipalmata]|nr:DYH14 protein [Anseranas semipalmata]